MWLQLWLCTFLGFSFAEGEGGKTFLRTRSESGDAKRSTDNVVSSQAYNKLPL